MLRSLPFDFVKTRMQKMERGPDGKYPYAGPVDCALQTIKNEVDPQKRLLCCRLMLQQHAMHRGHGRARHAWH